MALVRIRASVRECRLGVELSRTGTASIADVYSQVGRASGDRVGTNRMTFGLSL